MSEYPVAIKIDVAVVNQEVEWSVVNVEAELAPVEDGWARVGE
jgi:hypothetical protein